jgi:hypothetical protein
MEKAKLSTTRCARARVITIRGCLWYFTEPPSQSYSHARVISAVPDAIDPCLQAWRPRPKVFDKFIVDAIARLSSTKRIKTTPFLSALTVESLKNIHMEAKDERRNQSIAAHPSSKFPV